MPTENELRVAELARQSRVLRRLSEVENIADFLEEGAASIRVYETGDGNPLSYFRELGAVDLTHVTVKRGRESAGEAPSPGTLAFGIRVRSPEDLAVGETGRRLRFRVEERFLEWISDGAFNGADGENECDAWVTDAQLTYESRGHDRAPVPVLQVVATGHKARGAQGKIGDVPWPQEKLSTRRGRIYTLIGQTSFPDIGNPYIFDTNLTTDQDLVVAAKDADRIDPVAELDDLAADVGGLVFESLHRPGRTMWQAIDSRANEDPLVELTADEVARTATWGKSLNGLLNRYTVEYGPEDDRHQVTVEDAASITAYGEFSASRSTQLVNEDDARRLATLIVGRYSRPRWTITRFDVDLLKLKLPADKAFQLLAFGEAGELIRIAGLPGTAPGARAFHIEGTELRITRHDFAMTVYVSEAGQTGAPPTWNDLSARGYTWDTLPAALVDEAPLTWLGAAGWYLEPSGQQRWTDQPRDLEWIELGPNVGGDYDERVPTWESYPDDPTP